jgi:hypothetical protein
MILCHGVCWENIRVSFCRRGKMSLNKNNAGASLRGDGIGNVGKVPRSMYKNIKI